MSGGESGRERPESRQTETAKQIPALRTDAELKLATEGLDSRLHNLHNLHNLLTTCACMSHRLVAELLRHSSSIHRILFLSTMPQPLLLPRCPTASSSTRTLFYRLSSCNIQPFHPRCFHSCLPPSRPRSLPNQQRHRPTSPSRVTQLYHSKHHPAPAHEYSNSQSTILSAALAHVPHHGFTREALTLGARDVGFLDVSVQLFPRGELDLIFFWLASRRGLLRGKVDNGLFESRASSGRDLSVEEKVKVLVLERLWMNKDIKHKWQDVCPSSLALSRPFSRTPF